LTDRSAIIIGAGPAGCIAALLLSRGGWSVTLVEQHRFPRDKVCGECLSALGHAVLDRLGLAESFHRLSPVRLTRAMIHAPDGGTLDVNLPEPMWGISRSRMDHWLLDEVRKSGATVIQPARCEQVSPRVVIRDLVTNELAQFEAGFVLLADGKGAMGNARPVASNDLGIKAHFEQITGPRDAIELFGVDGHYGGVAPIEDGKWNVAFSVPRSRVQSHRGDLGAMFEQIIQENETLKVRFQTARRASAWMASPLPRFAVSQTWPDRVIPLGNAAAAIEPVGGEGMGLAMRSAELAAQMLLSDRINLTVLRRTFQKLWRTRSLSCRATGIAVSNPALARWIAPSIGRMKPLARVMITLMGKTRIS